MTRLLPLLPLLFLAGCFGAKPTAARHTVADPEPVGYVLAPEPAPAIAVRMVWEVANAVQIPVCGVGGVMTGEDAAEFILAGATAVSVGMASFVDPAAPVRILRELEEWAESQGVSDINELIGAFEC